MHSEDMYVRVLEASHVLAGQAARRALAALDIPFGGRVLDVPCGLGPHAIWLAESRADVSVVGVDLELAHVEYARQAAARSEAAARLCFEQADMTRLDWPDDTFDCIWCCDGLWLGPPESGSVAEEPLGILADFCRMVRPGGIVALAFWSGQRLLPGYPLVEARLNATLAANVPLTLGSPADQHVMRMPAWLERAGLQDIRANSYVADIQGPLSSAMQDALAQAMAMFWHAAEAEVAPEVWREYQRFTSPYSDDYVLASAGYAGYIIYSVFSGRVP